MAKKKKEAFEDQTEVLNELLKKLDEAEKEYTAKLQKIDLAGLIADEEEKKAAKRD